MIEIFQNDLQTLITEDKPINKKFNSPFIGDVDGCYTYKVFQDGKLFPKTSVVKSGNRMLLTTWNTDFNNISVYRRHCSVEATPVSQFPALSPITSDAELRLKFFCSEDPVFTLESAASKFSIKVGKSLFVPLSITKQPIDERCWAYTELSVSSQSVEPITSQNLSITFKNLNSMSIDVTTEGQIGIHAIEVKFKDMVSKQAVKLSLVVTVDPKSSYATCDASLLYLELDQASKSASLPLSELQITVNETAKHYTLPFFNVKSKDLNVNAAACGTVVHSVRVKDSQETIVPADFISFVDGTGQLSIKAIGLAQAGHYWLELVGQLDSHPEVTET